MINISRPQHPLGSKSLRYNLLTLCIMYRPTVCRHMIKLTIVLSKKLKKGISMQRLQTLIMFNILVVVYVSKNHTQQHEY